MTRLSPLPLAAAALAAAILLAGPSQAQTARIRGTIASIDGGTLRIAPKAGGAEAVVALAPDATVSALVPARLADIRQGSFIGIAADARPDGTLVAREVHIFPESMRGAGEGHRPFDLGPTSSMTNGTVGREVAAASGDRLTIRYKGGEKTITVPAGAPVVSFAPGDRSLLVAGAHVQVQPKAEAGGTLEADRIVVGKDGLVPPM